jgi:hypothetical protein
MRNSHDSTIVIGTDTTVKNVVDAAIALTSAANLGASTPSNGYGIPKSATTAAALGLKVQKYGRTTSLTQGSVYAVNVTVNVGYTAGTARFVKQIWVKGAKSGFIKAGDSGSLLVTNPGCNPVGLLFAGDQSGSNAFANPITDVLSAMQVTIDGL